MREQTGLKYTDGTDICDGDIIVLWQEVESQKKLLPYVRRVEWSNSHAAYAAVDGQYGWTDYLGKSVHDPNCRKVTKYVSAEAILKAL